jgi:NAD(P)-dependent dehydrogenase (short-subunit alcohol dehydrogenase family)
MPALVTGAGRRLGRAIAVALARSGADVVLHCNRSLTEAEAVASEIRSLGRKAWVLQADLSEPAHARPLFEEARRTAGEIGVLVNSASAYAASRLTDLSADDLDSAMRLNAASPLLLTRALAAQGIEGCVVNILDARIVDYDREHAAYHLGKRALYSLTRMSALEFAPKVRVNAVAPGLILPPPGEGDAWLERLKGSNPLRAHGSAEDAAEAALFLIRGRFITGQVIFVDGGRHLKGSVS